MVSSVAICGEVNLWMHKYPELDEVSKVISKLHDRKYQSIDGLNAEVIKIGGRSLAEVLYS